MDANQSKRIVAPSSVSFDADDGSLTMEWIFGGPQGAPESWRATYYWSPQEGAHAWFIGVEPMSLVGIDNPMNVAAFLESVLACTDAMQARQVAWKYSDRCVECGHLLDVHDSVTRKRQVCHVFDCKCLSLRA